MGDVEALAARARPRRLRPVRGEARALQARRPGAALGRGHRRLRAAAGRGRGRRGADARRRRRGRRGSRVAFRGARRPRRQPDRRSPSPPAATSARCTPPPAPPTARRRRSARARPPVFGPRRARMAAQARALGPAALEQALGLDHGGRARPALVAAAARAGAGRAAVRPHRDAETGLKGARRRRGLGAQDARRSGLRSWVRTGPGGGSAAPSASGTHREAAMAKKPERPRATDARIIEIDTRRVLSRGSAISPSSTSARTRSGSSSTTT